MKNIEDANQKSKDIFQWFMEIRKEFPNVELNKSGNETDYQIFLVGTKVTGSDYELNCWKDVPILECGIRKYSEIHPTEPNLYYLDLRLNFKGGPSSEDWKLSELDFKAQVRKAFIQASKDFLIEKI